MLNKLKRKRTVEQVGHTALPQPEQALSLQLDAEKWRQLAEREVQVARLLRTCMVEQQEILMSWENMDPSDTLAGEALALETAFRG